MSETLATPESIVSDPKFGRISTFSKDETDVVNLFKFLSEGALKLNAEASKERAKGNDQAIKAYTSAMDTKVKSVSALTKYIGQLRDSDAKTQVAAIRGIVDTAKAQMAAFTKLEQQESSDFHPWYETAVGNAVTKGGSKLSPQFWQGLVGTVINEAEIHRDDINIPWFVRVLKGKIKKGEIGDWQKMKAELGEQEYAKLQELWAAAETAESSRIGSIEISTNLVNKAESFARLNANSNRAEFERAASELEPLVGESIQSISQGKSVEQLKSDAEHFYSTSKVEKLEATADKYTAYAMDLLESLGYASKDGAATGGFSVDRWAPWRGSLVNDPKFQTWARERGYNDLGRAQIDENGKVLSYVRGADDNKAIKAYGRATRLETLDAAGYDTEPVSLTTALPYASVRSGTITDLHGDAQTVVAVNRGGKQSLYTMTRDGAPVPLTDAADLGINTNEIAWDGEPTAYAEIKDIKDDAQVARAYAAHLKDGGGIAGEVEAPAPTEDWTVTPGAFVDSDRKTVHDIYGVSNGKSLTQWYMRDLANNKFVETDSPANAVFGDAVHIAPARVAEFAGAKDGHAAVARLWDEAVKVPTEITQGLFLDGDEYAKAAPKSEAKDATKPEAKAGPAAWNVIETDKTPASETFIGSDYGTTARDGERKVRVQGGDVRTVGEKDTVAPLKKEEEYTTTRLNAEDRLINRRALASDNEKAQEIARSNLSEPQSLGAASNKTGGHPDQAPSRLVRDPLLDENEAVSPPANPGVARVVRAAFGGATTDPAESIPYAAKVKFAAQADARNKRVDALPVADESQIGDRTIQARKYLDAHAKLEEYIIAAKAAVEAAAPDKRPALQAKLTQYEDAADTLYRVLNTTFKDEVNDIIKKTPKVKKSAGVSGPDGLNKFKGAAKPSEDFQTTAGEAQRDFKQNQTPGTYDSGPVPKPRVEGFFDHKPNPPVREMTRETLARRGVLPVASNGAALSVRPGPLPASDKKLTRANDLEPLTRGGPPVVDPNRAPTEKMAKDALRNELKKKWVGPSMSAPEKVGSGIPVVKP